MADAFYRKYNEALNDPNVGLGLLLYQCIQYKIAHPEADVEICYSSYRTSPTIAVCVVPQSRYYGYPTLTKNDSIPTVKPTTGSPVN